MKPSDDIPQISMSYFQLFKRMAPFAKKNISMFFAVQIAIFTYAICSRLLPQLIGYAIDEGVLKNNSDVFLKVTWLYLILEIIKSVSSFSSSYLFQIFGNRTLHLIRQELMAHIQKLPIEYFNKNQTGRIVTRLTNDVATLGELFTNGLISIFIQVVVMISIFIAMATISLKLTFLTLGFSPIFFYAAYRLSEYVKSVLREQKKHLSTLNSFLAENLNGMKVIQLYNRTEKNIDLFKNLTDTYFQLNFKSIRASAFMQPVINIFTAVTITIALYKGGVLSLTDAIPIGGLIAFLMHAQDFIPPLREIIEKYQQFQNSLASAERVFQILDEPVEIDSVAPHMNLNSGFGDIEFKNLSFSYGKDLPSVIKNLSLKINAGQSIALVGRTGSGKSTLVSLLQRFYEAPSDSIFINHMSIDKVSKKSLRQFIGVCQQDNYIFKGSLLENITLENPDITYETALNAVKTIGYWDLLERTGRNLNSLLEEKGANVSLGERQLISFARILAFNPKILILDEATANIDSESEKLIQDATMKLLNQRTSIIIAHRLSTIQHCDQIIVLKDGEIYEQGTHAQLMAQNGYYSQLALAGFSDDVALEEESKAPQS